MFRKKGESERQRLSQFWDYEAYQLELTKQELDRLYLQLENVTDERLTDSIIYEIKSQEARYDYHYQNIRMLEERTDIRG